MGHKEKTLLTALGIIIGLFFMYFMLTSSLFDRIIYNLYIFPFLIILMAPYLILCYLVLIPSRKRDCKGAFWVAFFFSPIIGFMYVIASPTNAEVNINQLMSNTER